MATKNGHLCVVEYLINPKADINAKSSSVIFFNCDVFKIEND